MLIYSFWESAGFIDSASTYATLVEEKKNGEGKVRKYLFGKEKINGEGTRLTHNCSSQVDIGKFGIWIFGEGKYICFAEETKNEEGKGGKDLEKENISYSETKKREGSIIEKEELLRNGWIDEHGH